MKQLLTTRLVGAITQSSIFDESAFSSNQKGDTYGNGTRDKTLSLTAQGGVNGDNIVIGTFATSHNYMTIFENFSVSSIQKNGNSAKDVYFEVVINPNTGEEYTAATFQTETSPVELPFPVSPGLGSGTSWEIRASGKGNVTVIVDVLCLQLS